jgi:iron complex transport system substrate-binding protein
MALRRARFASVFVVFFAVSALGTMQIAHGGGDTRPVDVSRIAAIGGDVTEILYALGLESKIVAVDSTSVYPPEALQKKTNLGYMRALSTEGVLATSPTLIVASAKAGPPEVVAALRANAPAYVAIDGPDTPEGISVRVKAIAAALGANAKAEEIISLAAKRFDALKQRRAGIQQPVKVLFLLSVQNGRATAAGAKTAADEVIRLSGGTNVASAFDGYKPLSAEAAAVMAPDVVLVMNRSQQAAPSGANIEAQISAIEGLRNSPAIEKKRVHEVDGAALMQFGPRTADAAHALMDLFYPAQKAEAAGK